MRFAFTFALALGLSFPSLGMTPQQQDSAGSANAGSQAPPAQSASTEQAPTAPPAVTAPDTTTEKKPPADDTQQQAPENDTKGKPEPDSAGTHATEPNSANAGAKPDSATPDSAKPDSATPDSSKAGSSGGASSAETSSAETRSGATKRPSRTVPPAAPRKVVVRRGGAKEPATQIAPGMTPAEAARERQNAEQWLRSTGDQLPRLAELTNSRHQETMGQIRNYMDGARSALQEGDVRRASTLAEKAHLLAEDLLKR